MTNEGRGTCERSRVWIEGGNCDRERLNRENGISENKFSREWQRGDTREAMGMDRMQWGTYSTRRPSIAGNRKDMDK